MKNLITLCLLVATLCLAWRYREAAAGQAAAEEKAAQLSAEIESLRAELKSANARLAQASGPAQPGLPPGAKPNWIEEKNRAWQSSLNSGPGAPGGAGKGRQRGAMPTPPPPPPQPTAYQTDAKGRYWVDAAGVKHYVP